MNASKNKKTIFISITTPIVIRNFMMIPGSVFEQLKKNNDIRIVLCTPSKTYEQIKNDFEDDGVVVEPIEVSFKKSFIQSVGIFFTTYLNFTDLQRLEATMGVRIDIPISGGKRFLNPLKEFISKTAGKITWIRTTLAPIIDEYIYGERPYKKLFEKYMAYTEETFYEKLKGMELKVLE